MTGPVGVDLRLERFTIRCRTTPQDQERALAVRGRLARLATERLPAALARALGAPPGSESGAGGPDIRVDRLVVPLGFDPADHDDETVVLLWAEHIRAALAARLPVAHPAPTGEPPAEAPAEPPGTAAGHGSRPLDAAQQKAVAGLSADLVHRLMGLSPAALSRVARRPATRPDALAALWSALDPDERQAVRTALAGTPADCFGAPPAGQLPAQPDPSEGPAASGTTPVPGSPHVDTASVSPADRVAARQARAAEDTAGTRADAADAEALLASLLASTGSPASGRPLLSRAGGLVLLYPWLADYLDEAARALGRDASRALGDATEADLRRVALAVLADPADTDLQCDPLVMVLAGRNPAAQAPLMPDGAAAARPAEAALRRFAASLPGFARSSAAYLRTGFLLRPALLEEDTDGLGTVGVELGELPLDIALARLPYPLGLFTLPWSPPVRMRFAAGSLAPPPSPERGA
jgi:hypothetical protein